MEHSVGALSVLVVEDDAALRTLFIALLNRQGFRVECVNDGAQALERLSNEAYNVMLLDLMMPIASGFDVLDRLRETSPALLRQTIVTTGVSERELAKLDHKGVFAVLRKPFDIDRLVSTVRQCARQAPKARPHKESGRKLDRSMRKFESVIPELRKLLHTAAPCDRELMLRGELRRVMARLGRVLTDAAAMEGDADLAKRCEELGSAATQLSALRAAASATHEH